MRKKNPHNRKTNRLCGFFHGGTVNIRVVTEWFRKRSKACLRPQKRHTQDRDMPPIGKRCATMNPSRTRHEPVIARMRVRNYTKDLYICNIFCNFAAQIVNSNKSNSKSL